MACTKNTASCNHPSPPAPINEKYARKDCVHYIKSNQFSNTKNKFTHPHPDYNTCPLSWFPDQIKNTRTKGTSHSQHHLRDVTLTHCPTPCGEVGKMSQNVVPSSIVPNIKTTADFQYICHGISGPYCIRSKVNTSAQPRSLCHARNLVPILRTQIPFYTYLILRSLYSHFQSLPMLLLSLAVHTPVITNRYITSCSKSVYNCSFVIFMCNLSCNRHNNINCKNCHFLNAANLICEG